MPVDKFGKNFKTLGNSNGNKFLLMTIQGGGYLPKSYQCFNTMKECTDFIKVNKLRGQFLVVDLEKCTTRVHVQHRQVCDYDWNPMDTDGEIEVGE